MIWREGEDIDLLSFMVENIMSANLCDRLYFCGEAGGILSTLNNSLEYLQIRKYNNEYIKS